MEGIRCDKCMRLYGDCICNKEEKSDLDLEYIYN